MKKLTILFLLTFASFLCYGQDYITMGIRVAGGLSTMKNLERSEIFAAHGLDGISVGNRFAWDLGFTIQGGTRDGYFYQTDATVGMVGASISNGGYKYGGGIKKVDFHSFQSNHYLGKKVPIGRKTNFFVALGLYIDFHMDTELFGKSNTPDFVLDNFKDWDMGATLLTGIESGRVQLSINPQMGFIDLTRDRARVYSRSLKLAFTYFFFLPD